MIKVIEHFVEKPEESVVLGADPRRRLHIYPWTRNNPGVYVAVGDLNKDGEPRHGKREADYQNVIVPREDFVEAILAVFPELVRA